MGDSPKIRSSTTSHRRRNGLYFFRTKINYVVYLVYDNSRNNIIYFNDHCFGWLLLSFHSQIQWLTEIDQRKNFSSEVHVADYVLRTTGNSRNLADIDKLPHNAQI